MLQLQDGFAGGYGLNLICQVPGKDLVRDDYVLFSESNSAASIEVAPKNRNIKLSVYEKELP